MFVRAKGNPTHDEVRAAVDRIIVSDVLRHSPQLIAFLRFIVETTLCGEGGRIKPYTIAIEALGRKESFDPQADPIVRVEAGRLRRALEHYYAGPGATDDVIIDLPRRHYVPIFRHRLGQPVAEFSGIFGIGRGSLAAIPLAWRVSLAAFAFVLIGTTVLVAIGRWDHRTSTTVAASTDQQLISEFRAANGFPVVSVQAVEAIGAPTVSRIKLDGLHWKLTDALARFDEITVVAAATTFPGAGEHTPAEGPSASKYELGMTAEYRDDGTAALTFRLVDAGDNTLVWSRTFDPTQSSADENRVVVRNHPRPGAG